MEQDIRFCVLDGRRIAYASLGEGPTLLFGGRWVTHLEEEWEDPYARAFFEDLSSCNVSTLRRGPGANPAAQGAAVEIRIAFGCA